jgi:hypothetical protein
MVFELELGEQESSPAAHKSLVLEEIVTRKRRVRRHALPMVFEPDLGGQESSPAAHKSLVLEEIVTRNAACTETRPPVKEYDIYYRICSSL